MTQSDESFLIRSRELAAAQRLGLVPPPGKISGKALSRHLGLPESTVRKIELRAVRKLRQAAESDPEFMAQIIALISKPKP